MASKDRDHPPGTQFVLMRGGPANDAGGWALGKGGDHHPIKAPTRPHDGVAKTDSDPRSAAESRAPSTFPANDHLWTRPSLDPGRRPHDQTPVPASVDRETRTADRRAHEPRLE